MRTPEAKGRNLIDSNKMHGAKGRGTGHAEESNGHLQGGRSRPPREAEQGRVLPDDGSGGPNPHGFVMITA